MGGRSLLIAAGCVLAALLAGCGGDSSSSSTASTFTRPTAAEIKANEPVHPKPAPNPWREPRAASMRAHPGADVRRVIVHDVKRGTGMAVRPGDTVLVDYIEANYTTGHKFMRAWGGEPWPTEYAILTPENSMRGLIIGMTGMRAGGRRTIVVPRHLSDVHDSDRAGNSYHEIVYYDIVLRSITPRG